MAALSSFSLALLILTLSKGIYASQIVFPLDKACVAWRAKKTMFLVNNQNPVGMNCNIDVSFQADATGAAYVMQLKAPIKGFDSGEQQRDEEVYEILGGRKHPDIFVATKAHPLARWRVILSGGDTIATMRLNGSQFDLQLPFRDESDILTGVIATRFSDFKIKPPQVAFGLIASVAEELDLAFSIPKKAINGLEEAMAAIEDKE